MVEITAFPLRLVLALWFAPFSLPFETIGSVASASMLPTIYCTFRTSAGRGGTSRNVTFLVEMSRRRYSIRQEIIRSCCWIIEFNSEASFRKKMIGLDVSSGMVGNARAQRIMGVEIP
jgi:hypothetical protein